MNLKLLVFFILLFVGIGTTHAQSVELFKNRKFKSTSRVVRFPNNAPDLRQLSNKADSITWDVPRRWCLVLYDKTNYGTPLLIVKGKGSIEELDKEVDRQGRNLKLDDRFSSAAWVRERDVAADPNKYGRVPMR